MRPPIGPPLLVGDIGATNARFAILEEAEGAADGPPAFGHGRVLATEDYPTLRDAIVSYLDSENLAGNRPRVAAIAVASPVTGDEVSFTNHPWSFSISALRRLLGLDRLIIINDFTANALAVPNLGPVGRLKVGGGEVVEGRTIGILGPGSGLGVAGLVWIGQAATDPRGPPATDLHDRADGWIAVPGEGGHVTMAPANARESAVLDLMRRRFDHVSAERVLSGPGLVNLYNALAELDGVPAASYGPAQIANQQIGESDPLAREALTMFCAMLGTVAGNLALTLGARGGIYIAGGIVPRLGAVFAASPFRRRFEEKGRFSSYVAAIPTFVMTHPTPAFLGLAALARQRGVEV